MNIDQRLRKLEAALQGRGECRASTVPNVEMRRTLSEIFGGDVGPIYSLINAPPPKHQTADEIRRELEEIFGEEIYGEH